MFFLYYHLHTFSLIWIYFLLSVNIYHIYVNTKKKVGFPFQVTQSNHNSYFGGRDKPSGNDFAPPTLIVVIIE